MPTYEYRCEANGRLIEVRHNMAQRLSSWGETVEKLISAGFIPAGASSSLGEPACEAPGCGSGFCGTGACGMGE